MAGALLLGKPQLMPADRNFPWNPGMMSQGGIPTRSTIFTTLSATGSNDTTAIQNAIDACPAGQVVMLGAGTFNSGTSQTPIMISKGISLRGSGPGTTFLRRTTGAATVRTGSNVTGTTLKIPATQSGLDNFPLVIIGPGRFSGVDNTGNNYVPGSTKNLTVDGNYGSYSVTVTDATIFTAGQCVLIDELTVPSYVDTPRGFLSNNTNGTEGTVDVLAGDRVVWNIHTPTQTFQDDPPDSAGWFSRPEPVNAATSAYTDGRLTCEIKEIASINGNVITFTSPLAITYRTSHTAQVTRFTNGNPSTGDSIHISGAGIEDMTLDRSGGGGVFFNCAKYSWAKHIELDNNFGLGIAIDSSFRCEVRDSYIHTSAQPTPAADSYGVCAQRGSSECLIENNIIRDYCKVIAFRACGAGSVVGYNYTDDGWDWYETGNPTTDGQYAAFQECGINASHMGGPHHVLFEGNYSFNFDSDYTHGNSIYMTAFRNWLSGKRASISATETGTRCGGGASWSYYLTFIGNVLGRSGQMSGWVYTDTRMGCDGSGENCVANSPSSGWTNATLWGENSIWKIGYDPERWASNPDLLTLSTLIRDGNYDHLTSTQKWHTSPGTFPIPNSMYLSAKPTFFGANTWPWVDPSTGTTNILPAKKRYDDGTPNTVP